MRMIQIGLALAIGACDVDAPMILDFSPGDRADLRGAGTVRIGLTASDASASAIADLAIDGELLPRIENHACGDHCSFDWTWDTRTLPAGEHVLDLRLADDNGNAETESHVVMLDDIVAIKRLGVHDIVDDAGTLEIEVFAFDDTTNALLGCAGSRNGLGPVDVADVDYPVDARMIDVSNDLLAAHELATHAIRFEVWEDDDPPVCPVSPDPLGNDLLGKLDVRSLDQWRATPEAAAGNVTDLAIAFERPLSL
jgi:hypothetical protein